MQLAAKDHVILMVYDSGKTEINRIKSVLHAASMNPILQQFLFYLVQ